MKLSDLRPAPGATKRPKRVGRGPGSGHGKTSTKGHKGQKARSGGGKGGGFEGGQMPLYRRVPKRGFTPRERTAYAIVNVASLSAFEGGSIVDPDALLNARLIKRSDRAAVKLLGDGEIASPLTVKVHAASQSARKKVEAAGGRVEVLSA